MSEAVRDLTKAQLGEKLQVLDHAMKIRQEIILALISEQDNGRMHRILHYLTDLAQGEAGYLLLMEGNDVLTVDFFTEHDEVRFKLESQVGEVAITENPHFHAQPVASVFGGLRFSSSIVLPIFRGTAPLGIVEIGRFKGQIPVEIARQLLAIHRSLVPTYLVLKDHLVNISAKRTLQSQLSQTQQMYQTVMSGSHDLIVTFDPESKIQVINTAGRELLGIRDEQNLGQLNIISPALEFITSQLEKGTALSDIEVALHAVDGKTIFCLASFSAVWGDKNDIVSIHGVFKDITDRMDAQRELWQANIELSEMNNQLKINQRHLVQSEKLASIGQLAAGVAHEINNPLGFVQSNHVTMKQYLDRLMAYIRKLEGLAGVGETLRSTEKVARVIDDLPKLLDESDQGYHRIITIVQSLKDFSRIDALGSLSSVDLNKAIDDTLTVARSNYKYVAEVETNYELKSMVECYSDELNQVLLNIVVNAAQAITAQNRGSPGKIVIKTWEAGGRAWMQFDDDGPGIPDKIINRIFDPFFTTKPIGEGTGLGLSMAYDIVVKKHSGEIKAQKSKLGGAQFLICLPLLQQKDSVEVSDELEEAP